LIFCAAKIAPKLDHDQTIAAAVSGAIVRVTLDHARGDWVGGSFVGPAARTIVELNIKHYRELLKTEKDPSTRQTIVMLLAEEEAKLAELSAQERKGD
jgi:hypothetical protein